MHKVGLHIILLFLLGLLTQYQSHSQCVIQGPFVIPEVGQNSASITVSGLTNTDLSNPGQGLCGIRIQFRHTLIGDVLLQLRSPSGQVIQLTGPEASTSPTSLASWNVTFLPCTDVVVPDPGFSSQWDNDQPWALIGNYSGSYYPFSGCLESLTGPANGLWTITATDNQPFDGGEIAEIELIFCDDDGQNCSECSAKAGELPVDTVVQCANEMPANFDLTPSFPNGAPDPAYAYFYAVSYNGIVVEVTSDFDNTGLAQGIYTLCGVSVLHTDTNVIKSFPLNLTMANYETFLLASNLCFELSTACAVLKVNPELPPLFAIETICQGDTLFWRDSFFIETGNFVVRNPGVNGCLRNHNLALVVLDPNPGIYVQDSFDCGVEVATLIGTDSTFGNAVDFLWYTLDGSILTDPTLTQIDIGSSGTYFLITTRLFGQNGFCTDTANIELLNDFDEIQVSYRGDTITCAQDSIVAQAFSNVANSTFIWRNNTTGMLDTIPDKTIYWGEDFTLIAFSSQGCRDEISVDLAYDTIAPMVLLSDIQKLCLHDSVMLSAGALNPACAYLWVLPNGDSVHQHEFRTDVVGQFNLYVMSMNGCVGSDDLVVTHIGPAPMFQIVSDTFFCFTDSIAISVTSNLTEVSYQITGPNLFASSDRNTFIHDIGSYTVTVETINGCVYDTVWMPPADLSIDSVEINGGNLDCDTDSVQLSIDPTALNLQFEWSGPSFLSADSAPFVKDSGTYVLELTTKHGCVIAGVVNVQLDTVKPTISIQVDDLGCDVDSVQMMVAAVGNSLTYSWTGPNPFSSQQWQPWVHNSGTYQLTVTAENGCQTTDMVEVMSNMDVPNFSIESTDINCFQAGSDVTVTTDAAYIEWNGPSFTSSDTVTRLPGAGNYTLFLESSNGCDTTINFSPVADTALPQLQLFTDTIGCNRPEVPLYFRSDLAILNSTWNPGTVTNPFADSTSTSLPGMYRLAAIANNGCIGIDSIEVIADYMLPDVQIGGIDSINCLNDSAIIYIVNADASLSYIWTTPSNDMIVTDTIKTVLTGTYLLSAEASNTCRDTAYITVVVDTALPIINLTTDSINCAQSMATVQVLLSLTESVIWHWPDARNTVLTSFQTTIPGVYKAVVTNTQSGCVDSADIEVIIDTMSIDNQILGDPVITCNNAEALLFSVTSSQDVFLEWIGPSSVATNEDTIRPILPGMYFLRTTASSQCFDLDSIEVIVDTVQPIIVLLADTLTCDQDTITINFSSSPPVLSHEWVGPDNFMSSDSLPMITDPGMYAVRVTSVNGCIAVDSVLVLSDALRPTISIEAESFSCIDTTATATAVTTGDIEQYVWDGPNGYAAATQTVVLDRMGTYIARAVGSNGCVAVDTLLVTEFDLIEDVQLVIDSISCHHPVARHTIVTEPGTFIEWFEGLTYVSSDSVLSTIYEGSITLNLVNANGCAWHTTFTPVIDTVAPTPSIVQVGDIQCANRNVTLFADDLNDSMGFSFAWITTNGEIVSDSRLDEIEVAEPGYYSLFVTDSINGCIGSAEITVNELVNDINIGSVIVQQPNCLNGYEAVVELADVTGQTGSLRYFIPGIGHQFDPVFSTLDAGAFSFIVEDANGCQDTAQVTIDDVTVKFVDIERDTSLILGQSIFIDPISNIHPDQIANRRWTINGVLLCEGCDTLYLQPSISGNYAIHILDTNGCLASDSILIQLISVPALYIPNAFSPNDDGINDAIGPYFGNNVLTVHEFSIYSRWGDRLHHRTNMTPGDDLLFWDGRLKDQFLNPGVFIYTISVELIDGRVVNRKGEIHLIR